MPLFGPKATEQEIQLQNIVLGLNEKKLEVSKEFLADMTKIYISKRMKIINDCVATFEMLKTAKILYQKYDLIYATLDELQKLDGLYEFKSPTPAEYKEKLERNRTSYVNKIILRRWHHAAYNGANPEKNPEIGAFFREMLESFDILPPESQEGLNELHTKIFGYGINEEPPSPEEEKPEDEETEKEKETDDEE